MKPRFNLLFFILPIFVLLLVACSGTSGNTGGQMGDGVGNPGQTDGQSAVANPANGGPQGLSRGPVADCTTDEDQAIVEGLVETYNGSYDQIIIWYCGDSHSLDDILLAFETSKQTQVPPEDFLNLIAQGETWDEIWVDVGLVEE